jgi:hypothetical protein
MQVGDLQNRFQWHAAPDDETAARYVRIREQCEQLALLIDSLAPDSREKSLSITALEESMMWANAAIARNPGLLPSLYVYERRFQEKLHVPDLSPNS